MVPVPVRKGHRVLVLCDDPVEAHLLRSLLRALPEPRPSLLCPDTSGVPADAANFDICLLGVGYAGLACATLLRQLKAQAPRLRVIGVLGAGSRIGDRIDIVRALQSGMEQLVLAEELSVATLRALLQGPTPTDVLAELAPGTAAPPHTGPSGGSWRIVLTEQRASFDTRTLEQLGYAAMGVGTSLGDWKALIHPDDIDRLVAEIHGVLNGTAPPHPVGYRIRHHRGNWLPVVSDDIQVNLDDQGNPYAISGHFYREEMGAEPDTGQKADQGATGGNTLQHDMPEILASCETSFTLYRRDASGEFRVAWCNEAAANLEGHQLTAILGRKAGELGPNFDGFDLVEALHRVCDTGIAESRDVMTLARSEQSCWRSYRLNRLAGGEVLAEFHDITDLVNTRTSRRLQDEMAQYILRAFPLTTLVLDEQGRVVQSMAPADGVFSDQATQLDERSLLDLLGSEAGIQCLEQVQKSMNTGRPAHAAYRLAEGDGERWIECHSSVLRGRPGMPPRILLTLRDATEATRALELMRNERSHFQDALRRLPTPFCLKDLEGRYQTVNNSFGALLGVEEAMLLGKTDVEVFPDEIAMELHETDRRLIESGTAFVDLRVLGQGERRSEHYCFCFPVHGADGAMSGTGGLWIAARELASVARAGTGDAAATERPAARPATVRDELDVAAVSVVSRVEDVLADAGDYGDVLRRLEQLAETTMHAQALIHEVADQAAGPATAPLVALPPLALHIVELERVLLPPNVLMESEIEADLPPVHCDPVVFQQILLRGIRHARRTLVPGGRLRIALRLHARDDYQCVACAGQIAGNHVELLIQDDAAKTPNLDPRKNADSSARATMADLSGMLELAHGQGGHLQIRHQSTGGTTLHVLLRAGDALAAQQWQERSHSTVMRFPVTRTRDQRDAT
jgi:PAS domain-containing protein/DNA-binding NarL/FixJ family response regulator